MLTCIVIISAGSTKLAIGSVVWFFLAEVWNPDPAVENPGPESKNPIRRLVSTICNVKIHNAD